MIYLGGPKKKKKKIKKENKPSFEFGILIHHVLVYWENSSLSFIFLSVTGKL